VTFVSSPESGRMTEYCKVLRVDIERNLDELSEIHDELRTDGIHLSVVRILDILILSKIAST
jgi:hypothetical protein